MATQNSPSLRTRLTLIAALVATLASLASGALLGLTGVLHETVGSVGSAVESVHLTQDAEIDLLTHMRADEAERLVLEENIRGKLAAASRFAIAADEARLHRVAERRVAEYLVITRSQSRSAAQVNAALDRAYGSLEALVNLKTAQSRAARERADRWDEIGNVLGIGASVVLLSLTAWLLFWLWTRAFDPITTLSSAMNRFAAGDRGARAEESGAADLRAMARGFNGLADTIAAQRDAQMAFLAGVAHDLRNPLSALKLSVATINPDAPLPPEPNLRRTLVIVDRQLTRMERMLGDLIDTAKTEAGQLELRLELHDARELVHHAVELFESSPLRHPLHVHLPDEPVLVECDGLRIEQVIGNLISNALKYSPDATPVSIGLTSSAGEAVISVVDHGIGIPEHDRAGLFEPFRRGRAAQDGPPGVGLGLFVGRRIIESHGGHIEVDSEPGRGSTFRVYLALADPAHAPRGRAAEDRSAGAAR